MIVQLLTMEKHLRKFLEKDCERQHAETTPVCSDERDLK